jgi:hypothetical protein
MGTNRLSEQDIIEDDWIEGQSQDAYSQKIVKRKTKASYITTPFIKTIIPLSPHAQLVA